MRVFGNIFFYFFRKFFGSDFLFLLVMNEEVGIFKGRYLLYFYEEIRLINFKNYFILDF